MLISLHLEIQSNGTTAHTSEEKVD